MMACVAQARCGRTFQGLQGLARARNRALRPTRAGAVLLGFVLAACEAPGGELRVIDAGASNAPMDAANVSSDAGEHQAADADAAQALADAAQAADAAIDLTGLPELCARAATDAVRDVFCVPGAPAQIGSLRELQAALGVNSIPLDMDEATAARITLDPNALIDSMVFLGHSTALLGRVVSAINPRALILGRRAIMAFQRGVQQVEIISPDREDNGLNFYLVSFRQACNDAPRGCAPGDLYTPQIERDWTAVTLHDDEDLKNAPSDCRQCHQRGLEHPVLLMRELQGPWTHFFAPDPDDRPNPGGAGTGGRELVRAFKQAKTGEIYAGVPAAVMSHTVGVTLQNAVFSAQPLEFPSLAIEYELVGAKADGARRRSATWDAAYGAFKRGEQLALPHFEPNPADAHKQAQLIRAYQRYRAGELGAEQLPDLADIFPDDPQLRAEIGLQVEPDATPVQALIQSCCPCHNDVLDQSISRARFNVALSRLGRSEIDLAIERIQQPRDATGVMPPPESRQLTDAVRARLLEYLRQTERPAQDDALLEQAAVLGMAKERWPGMLAY
jgi:hypothetical protein